MLNEQQDTTGVVVWHCATSRQWCRNIRRQRCRNIKETSLVSNCFQLSSMKTAMMPRYSCKTATRPHYKTTMMSQAHESSNEREDMANIRWIRSECNIRRQWCRNPNKMLQCRITNVRRQWCRIISRQWCRNINETSLVSNCFKLSSMIPLGDQWLMM